MPMAQMTLAEAKAAMLTDEDFAARMEETINALIVGFLPSLKKCFPQRWSFQDPKLKCVDEIIADIAYVSGYKMEVAYPERSALYTDWKAAFETFREVHKMPESCITFHGSSRASVEAIHEHGFDPECCKEGAYGNGAYVSHRLSVALAYAKPDKDGLLWAVHGRAHLGDPSEIPIGIKGQTDFGVRKDGTRQVTLTNPARTYWCLSDPLRQFISGGFIGFRIATDKRPTDFALVSTMYAPEVWQAMKDQIPGIAAYKQGLLEKQERKAHKQRRSAARNAARHAAWAAEVGSRAQPPRAVKARRVEWW